MDPTNLTRTVSEAMAAAERRWERHDLVDRLWTADPTVWTTDPTVREVANRLGWLRLHERMRPRLDALQALAAGVDDATEHVVLCGMGGSSLAPEVFGAILGGEGPELVVLDSTHPEAVAGVVDGIDPEKTVFVVSSKSGTTLETLSYFRTCWDRAGGDGSRFVAVTDPGSPLGRLGRQRGFRAVVEAFPDVGGRFSALTDFGLVPAALAGIEVEALLDAAAAVDRPDRRRDAARLGLAWGTLAAAGRDKLTVLTSPSLSAFPAWMEQLLAESLGKDGTGIVPVADEPVGSPERYGEDRAFVAYRLHGEQVSGLDRLVADGHPAVTFDVDDRYEIAAQMLVAEVATAAAGEVLGVHPFDQPNVEAAKRLAREAMDGRLDLGSVPAVGAADAARTVADLVDGRGPGMYVALQAYLPASDELGLLFRELRQEIRARSGAATTFGWGPRFLHSTGQLHKGGPADGVFLQFVDRPAQDLPVPETDHTFGGIIAAQAAGDHQALSRAGRRVVRVDLGSDRVGSLRAMLEGLA